MPEKESWKAHTQASSSTTINPCSPAEGDETTSYRATVGQGQASSYITSALDSQQHRSQICTMHWWALANISKHRRLQVCSVYTALFTLLYLYCSICSALSILPYLHCSINAALSVLHYLHCFIYTALSTLLICSALSTLLYMFCSIYTALYSDGWAVRESG